MRAVRAVASAVALTFGIDTVLRISKEQAIALLRSRIAFRVGYIDELSPEEVADITSVGMQLSIVTYALEFNPAHTIARLEALGIPKGVTVWIDVEGTGLEPDEIIAKTNTWAAVLQSAGYEAGIYVGAGCPLSSAQLTQLVVTRYWHSVSKVLESSRGFCMRQIRPDDVVVCGIKVDVIVVEPDYCGDVPMFAAA